MELKIMSKTWVKVAATFGVLSVGVGLMAVVSQNGPQQEEKEIVDTRPTISVTELKSEFHQVEIIGHGEVKPLEKTMLSAQVSGEVVKWHPNFVAGGLVKRGEVLFEVEPDNYEVALLQAKSSLASAQVALIEEQGRADVAKQEAKSLPDSRVTDLYLRKPQLLSAKAAVKLAEASVKLAQRDLDNTKVMAPYDALVISRNLGTGQFINAGANIGEIYNVEKAEITIPVAGFDRPFLPNNVSNIQALITSKGANSYTRSGKIVRDSGVVDSDTRMTHLVVEVEDPYSVNHNLPKMLYGTYVEVSFAGQGLDNIYRLRQDLVTNRNVWLMDDDGKLRRSAVNVLREEGEFFLINEGLKDNELLVTTVPEYPQVGMAVKLFEESSVVKDQVEEDKSESLSPTTTASSSE